MVLKKVWINTREYIVGQIQDYLIQTFIQQLALNPKVGILIATTLLTIIIMNYKQ